VGKVYINFTSSHHKEFMQHIIKHNLCNCRVKGKSKYVRVITTESLTSYDKATKNSWIVQNNKHKHIFRRHIDWTWMSLLKMCFGQTLKATVVWTKKFGTPSAKSTCIYMCKIWTSR